MGKYGYDIINVLITDIRPERSVMDAMHLGGTDWGHDMYLVHEQPIGNGKDMEKNMGKST